MQHDATDQLHVEMAQLQRAARGLPHHRKGLCRELIEGSALLQALAKLSRLGAQLLVRERRERRLLGPGLAHHAPIAFDQPLVAAPEYTRERL